MKSHLLYLIKQDRSGIVGKTLKAVLFVLSLLYGFGVGFRNMLFRFALIKPFKTKKPVISVGNITWGGVGKTPLIIYLARQIEQSAKRPAILLRGYMTSNKDALYRSDEAILLKSQLPCAQVVLGGNRSRNARMLDNQDGIDIFLLDDGFQHRFLSRDLDIVMVDATDPVGNGFLIPRGMMREPVSALRRADILVISRADFGKTNISWIRDMACRYCPQALIVQTIHKPDAFTRIRNGEIVPISSLRGVNVCAVSSIGNPKAFEETLIGLGVKIAKHVTFIDHYSYRDKDFGDIRDYCRSQGLSIIVTTDKDAVKWSDYENFLDGFDTYVLGVRIEVIDGKQEFDARISRLLCP